MRDVLEPTAYDKAKIWSDYLGFHLRALIFLTLAIGCGRVGLGAISLEIEGSGAKYFIIGTALAACVAFFSFAAVMLVHISSVNIEYLFERFFDHATNRRSGFLFVAMIILEFGMLASIAVSLLSIASYEGGL
ncbi:hypothetical protein KUL25_07230 [Rhodobacteraceae bacterium N5(2021)]|uniref:Uncharacterized protein n=1 Tax=Gymnodinialimonas phycosphaerae TaxID=2841589 RepID=A0A975TXM4_9RHOB|nr:hypothetical protein [Gymnodinialimonas phycosphaerae]MBY4892554.1 hypothetical protein [Gymnodinialimonas phycosphaerae]